MARLPPSRRVTVGWISLCHRLPGWEVLGVVVGDPLGPHAVVLAHEREKRQLSVLFAQVCLLVSCRAVHAILSRIRQGSMP